MENNKKHKKSIEIKDRLNFLMQKLNFLMPKDFAEYVDIPLQTMYKYLKGKRSEISAENAYKICKKTGASLEWLLYGTGDIFSKNLIAEQPAKYINEIRIEIPRQTKYLIAKGNSMYPTIKDGDYVIYKLDPLDIVSGDIVVIKNEWDEILIKKYRKKKEKVLLFSENQDYPPVELNEKIKVIGKVLFILRKIKV